MRKFAHILGGSSAGLAALAAMFAPPPISEAQPPAIRRSRAVQRTPKPKADRKDKVHRLKGIRP